MITLTIDEKDAHVLRVSASYLLALAADTVVTGEVANNVTALHNQIVDQLRGNTGQTFNAAELSEADTLVDHNRDDISSATLVAPDAASVFGGKPDVAPSTVGAAPLPTAPEVTPAITSIPTPPSVPAPPVATSESAAPVVAPLPTSHAAGVELDVRGLPWDARIHSREKTKLANGQWKNKRGADAAVVTQIENELRGVMSVPAPLAPVADAIAPPAIVPPPPNPVTTASIANPSSAQPFPALMAKVTVAIAAHKLNQMQVVAIATQAGVPSLPSLLQRPDLIPNIEAAIDAQIMANEASGVPV